MKITSGIETITVDKAKALMSTNVLNRPLNERRVAFLTKEIKLNNFHLTGESIKVAQNGTLLDGQHRLMAVIESGKPVEMFVVRGLQNDAFKYIDTGKARTSGDTLGIMGIKNPAHMAQMARFIMYYQRGIFSFYKPLSNADVAEFVEKNHPSLVESYSFGFNKENKLVSPSHLAGMHYIFKKFSASDADDFCWKVAKGENINKENPIYLFRQRMLSDIRSSKKSMTRVEKIALLVKTWNAYRKNSRIKNLVWNSVKEPFPKAA